MIRRLIMSLLSAIGAVAVLDALLCFLMEVRIDPTAISGQMGPRSGDYGSYVVLAPLGVAAWAALLIGWSWTFVMLTHSSLTLVGGRTKAFMGFSIALVQAGFLVTFHPNFLLTVIPATARAGFDQFVEDNVPVIREIYFHWGLRREAGWIFATQVAALLALMLLFGASPPDRRSQL